MQTKETRSQAKRILLGLIVVGYLGLSGWFLVKHMIGDSFSSPLSYYFTWDMFPGYGCFGQRIRAIGRTMDGQYVDLLSPETLQGRYRRMWRNGSSIRRMDVDAHRIAKQALLEVLEHWPEDYPELASAYLVLEYWPLAKMDEDFSAQPFPSKESRFWNVIEEVPVKGNHEQAPVNKNPEPALEEGG